MPPGEEEVSAFFQKLKFAHPTSAILSIVECRPPTYPLPEAVKRLPSPLTSLFDPKNKCLDKVQLNKACESMFKSLTITPEEADYLEESTRLQAQSSLWFEHRKGRLTASKFFQICHTRTERPSISLLKDVMQYTQSQTHQVPALKWGVEHEDEAREQYVELSHQQHHLFEYHAAGLSVSPDYVHLGASPDGVVSCSCCGAGLLEIKCPYKHRNQHPHHVTDPIFCLHLVGETMLLKTTHQCYLQIQGQMAICKKDYCDFVCWTLKGMHVERIEFDPGVFSEMKPSLDLYFQSTVLPELLTHEIKDGETEKENCPPATVNPRAGYCLCGEGEHGRMIACDSPQCSVEWFHYKCVGVTRKPKGKWYCPICK